MGNVKSQIVVLTCVVHVPKDPGKELTGVPGILQCRVDKLSLGKVA